MSDSLVSVIIPVYNGEKYLEETIQSALASTHKPLEIIIVNDGSTDGSVAIVTRFSKENSHVKLISQKNAGVSAALNTGCKAAIGIYLFPLGADDLISEDYLSEAANILDSQQEVKVVYSEAEKFGEFGRKHWKLKPFSRNLLARDNMIFACSLFRKTDWEVVDGFSEDMKMGREDWEFWIKILKNGGEVVKLPFLGFFYRIHSGSKRKKTGTNQKKRERIAYLNSKHMDFFQKELNGPLRFQRTWSKPYNSLLKFLGRL
ncbi:glycosyltransferase involved in cell wall biosynthesis [Algoriphagus ratkowskyi]|uniref:Glycosyltransferase n=1 Tax=Algoriphagus ratkowskyi TaxID=57028 RepID=A0A2W7QNL7_9BACT|nr:glycosyltransferase [Algoriphagus ratkowskyi]PZX50098.1 glycosyltransferase involved in cell wall biosynthesis [Algoriphagus ratkowskyi]TXD75575.1 glycosyltransferase [Algoriphagus ratkowskyi]